MPAGFWPFARQPYLLSLSLKRLEIVGDILQLLLQLGTFTVDVFKKAGEKERKVGGRQQRRDEKSESLCREDWRAL